MVIKLVFIFFLFMSLLLISFSVHSEEIIEPGSINGSKKMTVPVQMKEMQFNLDKASQTIANHDYYGTKLYLDRAISLFQGLKKGGRGAAGMQATLDRAENEIFITHQQMILGQRKREMDAKSVFRKTQQRQVPALGNYYDLWARDVKSWQPD